MTETTKEIFETYQVRKTKRQKTAFLDYVQKLAERQGYDYTIEKGYFGARNMIIGEIEKANILYTAHYDTCPRLPFPNFITPKNFLIYLLYQFLIVGVFFAAIYTIGFLSFVVLQYLPIDGFLAYRISNTITQILCYVFLYFLLAGPANKHTANDNTSGVTTILSIMENLPEDQRNKVAFVLFDLEEMGLWGSLAFAAKHKRMKTQTPVLNFDCVSDGNTILFALKRTTKKYAQLLEKAFVSTDDISVEITRNAFYPSDNASFQGGIGVAALKKTKCFGILYMDRIHTNKDVVYREENIQFLTDGAIKLAQML